MPDNDVKSKKKVYGSIRCTSESICLFDMRLRVRNFAMDDMSGDLY